MFDYTGVASIGVACMRQANALFPFFGDIKMNVLRLWLVKREIMSVDQLNQSRRSHKIKLLLNNVVCNSPFKLPSNLSATGANISMCYCRVKMKKKYIFFTQNKKKLVNLHILYIFYNVLHSLQHPNVPLCLIFSLTTAVYLAAASVQCLTWRADVMDVTSQVQSGVTTVHRRPWQSPISDYSKPCHRPVVKNYLLTFTWQWRHA